MAMKRAKAKSRVSRAASAGKATTGPGPVTSKADLRENTAPSRGAGPTKVGANTPVPPRGRGSSTVKDASPRTRDMSQRTTGQTIVQRANAVASRSGGKKGK